MDRKEAKVVATIEARMNSSRLPGKVMKPILGRPSIERLVERVRKAKRVHEVILATTTSPSDDRLVGWASAYGLSYFRGSEEDVLLRVLRAAQSFQGEIIVELTGDCPLVDPDIIDALVEIYVKGTYDYVSNTLERTYPRGLDVQVFSTETLAQVERLTQDPADREHVSLYIYEHPKKFACHGMKAPLALSRPDLRICVDTTEDFQVVESVYKALYKQNPDFNSHDVLQFLRSHPEISDINKEIVQKAVRP